MPKKKDLDYDSFDDDSDDDTFLSGMKLKNDEGVKPVKVNADTYSRFEIPTKLWPYDYITGQWKDTAVFKGIGAKRVKSFLSDEQLVNGSENGGTETRWSDGHELWEGTIEATGQKGIFFSGESMVELCDLFAEQCTQTPKSAIKPDPSRCLRASSAIEPGTLQAVRPADVNELRELLESVKGDFFSLILAQSRQAWAGITKKGGTALAVKTQRFEGDNRVIMEVGWAHLKYELDKAGFHESDGVDFMVLKENLSYRNGGQIPNNRESFGFGKKVELPEAEILRRLHALIETLSVSGPVMLIFHGADEELGYFVQEMDQSNWMTSFPADIHRPLSTKNGKARYPVIIQDTQRLYAAYRAEPQYAQVALSRACREEGMECRKMYNAGNDAYYALQLYDLLMHAAGRPSQY